LIEGDGVKPSLFSFGRFEKLQQNSLTLEKNYAKILSCQQGGATFLGGMNWRAERQRFLQKAHLVRGMRL